MEESENNSDLNAAPVMAPKVDPKILIGVVVLVLLAVYIVITFSSKLGNTSQTPKVEVTIGEQAVVDPNAPKRVDSVGVLPEGFPKELILEESVRLGETYTLHYEAAANSQLTITFASKKSAAENFVAYEKFLTEKFWIVLNKQQSATVHSLYAMKGNEDINITIEPGITNLESKVIISLLKK